MVRIVLQVLVNGVAVVLLANALPGVHFTGGLPQLAVVGLTIGLLNLLVKPIVTLLSLPFVIMTLGLFFLVINGLMFYLAGMIVPDLTVDGWLPAVVGGFALAVVNWLFRIVASDD